MGWKGGNRSSKFEFCKLTLLLCRREPLSHFLHHLKTRNTKMNTVLTALYRNTKINIILAWEPWTTSSWRWLDWKEGWVKLNQNTQIKSKPLHIEFKKLSFGTCLKIFSWNSPDDRFSTLYEWAIYKCIQQPSPFDTIGQWVSPPSLTPLMVWPTKCRCNDSMTKKKSSNVIAWYVYFRRTQVK